MSDNEEMIKVGKDTFEKIIQYKELEKNLEFQNAVNTFYKLKGEYEEKLNEQKRKIAKKSHLSAKEKRDEFKQLKIPCVNCKRRVGTIFQVKYKETDNPGAEKNTSKKERWEDIGRVAKAMCGDRVSPCPLDIEINLGKIQTVAEELQTIQNKIVDLKKEIVLIKNNLLFGFIETDKAVEKFEQVKEELSENTEDYEVMLMIYMKVYENPDKKEEAKNLELKIYNDIKQIKQYIFDFNREKNIQFAEDAVTLLISQLIPSVVELRTLKYPVMNTVKIDNQCKLIQKKMDYVVTETNIAFEDTRVVNFKMGVK
jgi:hypothetical protein